MTLFLISDLFSHQWPHFMLMLIKILITILMLLCTSVTFFHQNVNENKMLIKLFSSATSPPAVRWWALLASTIGGLLSSHFISRMITISYLVWSRYQGKKSQLWYHQRWLSSAVSETLYYQVKLFVIFVISGQALRRPLRCAVFTIPPVSKNCILF